MTPQRFHERDLVTLRDGDGLVGFILSRQPSVHAGEYWYRVQFGASQDNCRESDLRPHVVAPSLAQLLAADSYGGPDAFRRHATAVKLKKQLTDTLYSYGASKTQLFPYQFVPLLKFLSSPYSRILIADEVGLGKTIEAGYILQEQLARGRLARVLIVCPASLRLKWHDELFNRFGHRFKILDAAGARQHVPMSESRSAASNPLMAIVSIQSIRNVRFIETVAASPSPLDLLIVDEAHHCRNSQTLQAKAVSALIEQSDSVVFLSATPIQTSELNLYTLLNMLVPEEFPSEAGFRQRLRLNQPIVDAERLLRQQGPDKLANARDMLRALERLPDGDVVTANPLYRGLVEAIEEPGPDSAIRRVDLQEQLNQLNLLSNVFTRTKRRDVQLVVAQRRAVIPEANLTPEEQEVYDRVSDFIFEQYQERHGDGAARLVLATYQRQLASSLPASIRKFQELIRSAQAADDDEIESFEEGSMQDGLESRYRPTEDPEFQDIVLSIDVEGMERSDTKYELLLRALQEQHGRATTGERRSKKVLVFSYFRRSLDYLEQRLGADGFSLVRIDGSVKSTTGDPDSDERQMRIARFRDDPVIDIMLTSEVGSEGLDFQFCDAMVNWDLPWNPMVVEQRIGRLDRIGQRSETISIVNLACNGTIEARILRRLYDRIGIFEHSIGELEPILGDIVRELEEELFRPRLSEEEQIRILHAREIAIENLRKKQQALESQAEMLIGHDEFFRAKLDRIRRFGRYIGGDELRLFADNELRSIAPGLVFEADNEPGLYTLAYKPEVERVIDAALPKGEDEGIRFVTKYRRGTLRIAFDGETAERYTGVEPLHAQHPLIRAMAHRLDDTLTDRPQTAVVSVRSIAVRPGPWFYLWALIVETGFLSASSLMCSVVDLTVHPPVVTEHDAADELLADMLRAAEPWPDFNPPSAVDAQTCIDVAEARIRARVDQLHSRRAGRIQAIKDARRGAVEATFDIRINRQRQRVCDMSRRAPFEKGAEQILPAMRARLEHLEADRGVQLARIESLKLGTVTYALLGAGFVNVLEPSTLGGA